MGVQVPRPPLNFCLDFFESSMLQYSQVVKMRNCKYCGKELQQHEREPDYNFGERQCCSISCASLLKVKTVRDRKIAKYNETPILCLTCQKPILAHEKEHISYTKTKKFCSHACSAVYSNKIRVRVKRSRDKTVTPRKPSLVCVPKIKSVVSLSVTLPCLYCQKPIGKNAKKFCSTVCATSFFNEDRLRRWKNKEISGNKPSGQILGFVRRYMFALHDNKCQLCGFDKRNPYTGKSILEIHHIDGDWNNSWEDNLQVLCLNCHGLTKNYKNIGTDRKGRPRKAKEVFVMREPAQKKKKTNKKVKKLF